MSSTGLRITTQNGLCLSLDGDVEKYFLYEQEFLSGYFTINQCGTSKIFAGISEMDRLSMEIEDSCVTFEHTGFFYSPSTKQYSDFRGFRTLRICLDQNAAIVSSDKFHFDTRPVSDLEALEFVKGLDGIFDADSLLLQNVNGYGFVDMLFYCAISGNEKAKVLFSTLIENLRKRNLLNQYGGEPAQIYNTLKLIYDNI